MIKKHIIIPLLLIQIIKADHADDAWQKYNHKHQEEKEAHFKRSRHDRLKQAASNVQLDDHMKLLQESCLQNDCNACKELKIIMQQMVEERKTNNEALFKEILKNAERINTILQDPLLSDSDKKELVRPLQEKAKEFEKKLGTIGVWNFTMQDIKGCTYEEASALANDLPQTKKRGSYYHEGVKYDRVRDDLEAIIFAEMGGRCGIEQVYARAYHFWIGEIENIKLAHVYDEENVKAVVLRAPAPKFNELIRQLLHNRNKRFIAALEAIVQCDCKE